jgi:DNA oxidative demethylase
VFGGPSRFAYHGVPRIHPGTAPPGGPLAAGRLNLTLRVTGLPADAG